MWVSVVESGLCVGVSGGEWAVCGCYWWRVGCVWVLVVESGLCVGVGGGAGPPPPGQVRVHPTSVSKVCWVSGC